MKKKGWGREQVKTTEIPASTAKNRSADRAGMRIKPAVGAVRLAERMIAPVSTAARITEGMVPKRMIPETSRIREKMHPEEIRPGMEIRGMEATGGAVIEVMAPPAVPFPEVMAKPMEEEALLWGEAKIPSEEVAAIRVTAVPRQEL